MEVLQEDNKVIPLDQRKVLAQDHQLVTHLLVVLHNKVQVKLHPVDIRLADQANKVHRVQPVIQAVSQVLNQVDRPVIHLVDLVDQDFRLVLSNLVVIRRVNHKDHNGLVLKVRLVDIQVDHKADNLDNKALDIQAEDQVNQVLVTQAEDPDNKDQVIKVEEQDNQGRVTQVVDLDNKVQDILAVDLVRKVLNLVVKADKVVKDPVDHHLAAKAVKDLADHHLVGKAVKDQVDLLTGDKHRVDLNLAVKDQVDLLLVVKDQRAQLLADKDLADHLSNKVMLEEMAAKMMDHTTVVITQLFPANLTSTTPFFPKFPRLHSVVKTSNTQVTMLM